MVRTHPLVSVLMPAYNSGKYISYAIKSILEQSYSKIELIIINDGSSDNTEAVVKSFKDKRIKYIKNSKNLGLASTLNKGLMNAKGKYVARMDADDISLKDRILKQVKYLESHPAYGMIGTLYANMNPDREIYEIGGQLLDYEEIRQGITMINAFCHGSVMFNNEFLKKNTIGYKQKRDVYEDYELWTRLVNITKIANLDEVLYLYMQNPEGVFSGKSKKEIEQHAQNLGRDLQKKLKLQKLNLEYFKYLYARRKRYSVKNLKIDGKFFPSNLMLAYQTYLYKQGLLYLKRKNLGGLMILLLSFYLSPINWFKKLYR